MPFFKALRFSVSTAALGCLAVALAPASALAATVNQTMAVSATVQATCIVSASALGFGTYTGVVASSTSTISVTCTNTTPYNVGLDGGLTGTVAARVMKSGAGALNYGLFTDTLHSVNWGNTTGSWVAGTGSGFVQALTVYGQIVAGQYVTPGSYTDTITATINY